VFVEEGAHLNIPSLAVYLQRAKGLYEENRKAYIKMMLRRGFARLMVSLFWTHLQLGID
jgi:hypothetical protein